MPERTYPTDYFNEQMEQPKQITETSVIPNWVPILLAIAIVGAFAVALLAISKFNTPEKNKGRYLPVEI